MVACITAAKSHEIHMNLHIIQVATYKVRGSSEHQAGPAEHTAILQHCGAGKACLLSLFPSLVATPALMLDRGWNQKPLSGRWGRRDGGNEDHTSPLASCLQPS